AVILNSPCNPSGATIPYREMERFASLVERHDLLLISDECYEAFYYGSEPVISFAGFRQRLGDRLVIVNSFSKKFAMTGWRVGYLLGSAGLLREVKKLQTHDATHTSSISQWAAVTAIQEGESFVQAMREEFRSRRDLLLRILSEIPGVECVPPTGAFYAFPNVEGLYSRFGVSDTRELATLLIREARIATVPGEAFGCPGHLRISYALAPEDLQRGLVRLRDLVKSS
ncbi:MAG: aminotransferase class I/II-fold pyridoxal phosphate-dependent enzyme, partial [Acidobacteriota bacterium]